MDVFEIAGWRIERIEEMRRPMRAPDGMFSAWDAAVLDADWLRPDHIDPATGYYVATIGGFLLTGHGRRILFDAGVGGGKHRPSFARYHRLDSPFAARLGDAPVDTLLLSHLHVDHAGGATRWRDGAWRPAFPDAPVLVGDVELAHARAADPARDDAGQIWQDSIAPLEQAGLLRPVTLPHQVAPGLTLLPAPGHTPGQAVLRIAGGGQALLLLADVAHSILQVLRPDWNTIFCEDQPTARATRQRILAEAAAEGAWLWPTHCSHAGPFRVEPHGQGFHPRFAAAVPA